MLVSVIIPIYNTEKYLSKCINSVIDQSYNNVEIILIDDGSTDSSGRICDQYQKHNAKVRVVHTKNKGLSAARNIGIVESKGDYITFLDSDDMLHPRALEIMMGEMQGNQQTIVACSYVKIEENEKIIFQQEDVVNTEVIDSESAVNALIGNDTCNCDIVIVCAKLFPRKVFVDNQFQVGVWHEDEMIAHKLLLMADKIIWIKNKLYFYTQRTDSFMHTEGIDGKMDFLLAERTRLFELEKNEKFDTSILGNKFISDCVIILFSFADKVTSEQNKVLKRYIREDSKKIRGLTWRTRIKIILCCSCPQIVRCYYNKKIR